MTRPRRTSVASEESDLTAREQVITFAPSRAGPSRGCVQDTVLTLGWTGQELGSMYDYLAKIILLGPSGTGK